MMGLDSHSELTRIATLLHDAANLYRDAAALIDEPDLIDCFTRRRALRQALADSLSGGEVAEGSFLPTSAEVAMKLRALLASGRHAALTGVHDADEELLAAIADYLRHGDPPSDAARALRQVREALVADRGPAERTTAPRRGQPG